MSSLNNCKLGDLIEFQRGYDLPKSKFKYGPYPVQSSNGILGFHNEYKVEAPGITIGRSGTVGLPHLLNINFFPHNTALFVKDFKGNNVQYIYYLLKQLKLGDKGTGSGVPTMNRNHLHPLKIKAYRDVNEQEIVAKVLLVIDAKIEINNHINTELEAIAKTLYDYWFVQFDFPDANGKPYKTLGGKMVYNAALKREIPEGWADIKIGKMEPNIVTGKTPSTANSDYFNGEIPFITIGDIRGGAFIVKTEQTLSIEGANSQGNKYLPKGAICVTCIASPGLVGFVTQTSQTNQQINSVICSNEFNRYFLYFAINGYFAGAKAKTGNTFANMNKGDFSEILVVEPLEDIRKLFHEKIDAVFKEIKIKSQENIQLEQLRDYLLPMLMNGQVTVVNKDDI
jgi:type I restriction enzyme S subunit